MKTSVAVSAGLMCLVLAGCGGREDPSKATVADGEGMVQKQIELHLTMAQLLEQVGDQRTYQEALPVVAKMKKDSENLHQLLAGLPRELAADLQERFGDQFHAAQARLAKAEEDSRRRINTQLPVLNPKKK
jgi:hypothetical protein